MTGVLTAERIAYNQRVSVISAGVSIGVCVLVLLLAAWVWSIRSARGFLDRVSFRLLLWSMFFEIIYDVNYIAVVESASPTVINGRLDSAANARCSVGIFFMIGTLGVVNYLCTAIAVNLFITIVLGLNPIVLKLERWYVGVSLFIGFFVPVVPAALGHFGYDPIFLVCWIRADNDKQRMTNFVLDLYLWQLLSCVVASACVAATLIKLFRQGRATSRALFQGNSINLEMSGDSWDHEEEPKQRGLVSRVFHRRHHSHGKEHMFGHLEDRFIRIALRISLYPISLIIVNGIIAIGDLYMSARGGVENEAVYGLYRIYYFLYGARGIFFAALGLFVDPCLPRGLRAAWRHHFPGPQHEIPTANSHTMPFKGPFSLSDRGCVTPNGTRIDPLAASTVTNNGADLLENKLEPQGDPLALAREDSNGSVDMLHALLMSGPPEDHDHWTHEWHSGEHGAKGKDDSIRQKRQSRRSLSTPVQSVSRFLRRHSRSALTTRSSRSDVPDIVDVAERGEVSDPGPEVAPEEQTTPLATPAPLPAIVPTPPTTPEGFTMTFAGVATENLPEGFDDSALDMVRPEALQAAEAAAAEAAAEAAASAAAAALAREASGTSRGSTAAIRESSSTSRDSTPRGSRPTSGASTPTGPPLFSFGFRRDSVQGASTPPVRRGSLTSPSLISGVSGRRSSLASSNMRHSATGSGSGRIPPERRATAGAGSVEMMLSPIDERRQRRERALEIAERLYDEMEAQL